MYRQERVHDQFKTLHTFFSLFLCMYTISVFTNFMNFNSTKLSLLWIRSAVWYHVREQKAFWFIPILLLIQYETKLISYLWNILESVLRIFASEDWWAIWRGLMVNCKYDKEKAIIFAYRLPYLQVHAHFVLCLYRIKNTSFANPYWSVPCSTILTLQ